MNKGSRCHEIIIYDNLYGQKYFRNAIKGQPLRTNFMSPPVSKSNLRPRYLLSKNRVQCAGDVVFMVVHCLFPQSDLHIGVTLKNRRQTFHQFICSLTTSFN